MTQQIINIGSAPNDGTGDQLRPAFNKSNQNFTELYTGVATSQPLDADLTSLAAASATDALYYRSAAGTWTPVTIGAGLTFSGGVLTATGGAGGGPVFPDPTSSANEFPILFL